MMSTSTAPTELILHGASGRMGRAIRALSAGLANAHVRALLDTRAAPSPSGEVPVVNTLADAPPGAVVIDFSLPAAFASLIAALSEHPTPLVSGTTGLSIEQLDALREYSERAPVFYAENMSYGIAVLCDLAASAGAAIGAGASVEIVESHHRGKRDMPSGTALSLARAVTGGSGAELGDVPIHSIRAGGIPGDHEVVFATDEEVLTLSHRALSREVFARGAIRAARYVRDLEPGLYRMPDLVRAEREASIDRG